jgi:hypothetical protein
VIRNDDPPDQRTGVTTSSSSLLHRWTTDRPPLVPLRRIDRRSSLSWFDSSACSSFLPHRLRTRVLTELQGISRLHCSRSGLRRPLRRFLSSRTARHQHTENKIKRFKHTLRILFSSSIRCISQPRCTACARCVSLGETNAMAWSIGERASPDVHHRPISHLTRLSVADHTCCTVRSHTSRRRVCLHAVCASPSRVWTAVNSSLLLSSDS